MFTVWICNYSAVHVTHCALCWGDIHKALEEAVDEFERSVDDASVKSQEDHVVVSAFRSTYQLQYRGMWQQSANPGEPEMIICTIRCLHEMHFNQCTVEPPYC